MLLILARKKVEHAWKAFLYDGQTVSVTRPDRYADRFERFMFGKVFVSLPMTESLRRLNAQQGRSRPKLKTKVVRPKFPIEHIDPICSSESELSFDCIYSIGIPNDLRVKSVLMKYLKFKYMPPAATTASADLRSKYQWTKPGFMPPR